MATNTNTNGNETTATDASADYSVIVVGNELIATFPTGYRLGAAAYNSLIDVANSKNLGLKLLAGTVCRVVRLIEPDSKNDIYRINIGTGYLKRSSNNNNNNESGAIDAAANKISNKNNGKLTFSASVRYSSITINFTDLPDSHVYLRVENKQITNLSGDLIAGSGIITAILRNGLAELKKYSEVDESGAAIKTGYYYNDIVSNSLDADSALAEIKQQLVIKAITTDFSPEDILKIKGLTVQDLKKFESMLEKLI